MGKKIDCITFFDNNFMFDFRYNVMKNYVDKFVICESLYDHRNNKKGVNFDPEKKYINDPQILHIVVEKPFPKNTNAWQNQAIQRDYIIKKLNFAEDNDFIFFSDPDEILNPEVLKNFDLKKKYGIFLQRFFNYKFNIFNPYESPWEGTKVCKKKNLKSIDFMREKVRKKNLRYKFYRFDKEKNIQIFENAGWHFNNVMSPEKISKKLKTFAHNEFSSEEFSSVETIRNKINAKVDLFNRNEKYEVVRIDEGFPKYLLDNLLKFKDYIAN
jgi:beta-1,4-mannosyl-glycoprotein beta-1,4-N-acetylglucosaminyltransferase|tara:strand:+ start:46 stop:855 length:810 start_codon:yes stop_codon:yes gene_type:complete